MKHDRKNISKLLASLIILSFALSGGVVPTSAMEQVQEKVPTQNMLRKILMNMEGWEEKEEFLRVIRAGIRILENYVLWDKEPWNENFLIDLKKTIVRHPEKVEGGFDWRGGHWLENERFDEIKPQLEEYFCALKEAHIKAFEEKGPDETSWPLGVFLSYCERANERELDLDDFIARYDYEKKDLQMSDEINNAPLRPRDYENNLTINGTIIFRNHIPKSEKTER